MIQVARTGEYPIARCTTKKDRQCLIGIGDVHIGAETFDEKCFRNVIKYAVDNDAFVFFIGDMIENATRHSVGAGVYQQVIPPRDQLTKIVELLRPIPKENIIGGVAGNHENRTMKDSGFDPAMLMCDLLQVPYFGNELFAIITKEREAAYTLYATHSMATSATKGGTYNSVENKWFKFIDADIVAKGHGHDLGFDGPYMNLKIDANNVAVSERERWILLTGNYLRRANSYAASIPVPPKPCGTMALWLNMKKGSKTVEPVLVR